jgi:hypothetical protein
MTDNLKGLMPSEDEIRQILAQVIKENPANYPTVLLQIEVARLMVKCLDRLKGEFDESIKRLEDSIDNR